MKGYPRQIVRTAPVQAGRNAGLSRCPPIGLPSIGQLDTQGRDVLPIGATPTGQNVDFDDIFRGGRVIAPRQSGCRKHSKPQKGCAEGKSKVHATIHKAQACNVKSHFRDGSLPSIGIQTCLSNSAALFWRYERNRQHTNGLERQTSDRDAGHAGPEFQQYRHAGSTTRSCSCAPIRQKGRWD